MSWINWKFQVESVNQNLDEKKNTKKTHKNNDNMNCMWGKWRINSPVNVETVYSTIILIHKVKTKKMSICTASLMQVVIIWSILLCHWCLLFHLYRDWWHSASVQTSFDPKSEQTNKNGTIILSDIPKFQYAYSCFPPKVNYFTWFFCWIQ